MTSQATATELSEVVEQAEIAAWLRAQLPPLTYRTFLFIARRHALRLQMWRAGRLLQSAEIER